MNKNIMPVFDWDGCDEATNALRIKNARDVQTFRQYGRRTIEKGLEIGKDLCELKERLPHGGLTAHLQEIDLPYDTAYYWMRKSREFETFDIKGLDGLTLQIEAPGRPGGNTVAPALLAGDSQEWYTPVQYVTAARAVMGAIDVDPASCVFANQVVQATTFYTKEQDGMAHDWPGCVFLNPPYGYGENGEGLNSRRWTQKAIAQYETGIATEIIMLVNAATRFKWFQPLWAYPVCLVDHPIRFYNEQGMGTNTSAHDSAFVYMGPAEKWDTFAEQFSQFGHIVWPTLDMNRELAYQPTTDDEIHAMNLSTIVEADKEPLTGQQATQAVQPEEEFDEPEGPGTPTATRQVQTPVQTGASVYSRSSNGAKRSEVGTDADGNHKRFVPYSAYRKGERVRVDQYEDKVKIGYPDIIPNTVVWLTLDVAQEDAVFEQLLLRRQARQSQ